MDCERKWPVLMGPQFDCIKWTGRIVPCLAFEMFVYRSDGKWIVWTSNASFLWLCLRKSPHRSLLMVPYLSLSWSLPAGYRRTRRSDCNFYTSNVYLWFLVCATSVADQACIILSHDGEQIINNIGNSWTLSLNYHRCIHSIPIIIYSAIGVFESLERVGELFTWP